MSLPRLFDERGALVEGIDPTKFDSVTRSRYENLVAAYHANQQTEVLLGDAVDAVSTALEAVADAENFLNTRYPKQTYHDLWRENFSGGPRNRMTGQGRI